MNDRQPVTDTYRDDREIMRQRMLAAEERNTTLSRQIEALSAECKLLQRSLDIARQPEDVAAPARQALHQEEVRKFAKALCAIVISFATVFSVGWAWQRRILAYDPTPELPTPVPAPPDPCDGICRSLGLADYLHRDGLVFGYECRCLSPHRICTFDSSNGNISCWMLP